MTAGNIVITGASSGIGLACASRLAALGYRVFAGVRSTAASEAVRGVVPGITPLILDVCRPASIRAALGALGDEPLAGLINNAGIAAIGPLELVPTEAWRYQFEVNVIGLVSVTQACLPQLRRGKGRIVNIGSIAGRSALPGSSAYDSSKFALEGLSDALRMELRPFGISVSLIEPGAIATGIWDKVRAALDMRNSEAAPDLRDLYAGLTSRIREEAARSAARALPPEAVADAVAHAITASKPKTRYLVGRDAHAWRLLSLLPDRVKDWLILRALHGGKMSR
jgi:NAD(P)-dependent dehydrogenase (short-subunit alcohol dehydrogenase family)